MTTPRRWLRSRDPSWYPVRRAVRAAVVVPINFAIGSQLIGNAQVATFAAFGSFALLLFVNFPGGLAARAGEYLLLGIAGVALISLGTLLASPDWLAVLAMAVVTFTVLFAGVLSSVINAGTQAALLSFILAVMLPSARADLPDRLAGWAIAFAVAVPIALFVWPPQDQNVLRAKAAAVCRALAAMLHLEPPPPEHGDPLVALRRRARELRTAFRTSATRTSALSTGARLLIRLVNELEWLASVVTNACADAPSGWPEQGRRLRTSAARVLTACAETLEHDGSGPALTTCADLDTCIQSLVHAREAVTAEALARLRVSAGYGDDGAAAGEFERPLYAAHELGYAVGLAADTIAAIAAADTRPWWAKVTGRRPPGVSIGAVTVAQRVASGHLDRHSVWLQSSIRGAVGLTLAVLIARLMDAQNAFWVGLGALSVLRSTAVSTGATAVRALAGTVIGFAVGGAAVQLIGTNQAVLWTLLPLVILVAASAPTLIPFVAGQAAFTVFTIVLFNIIAPAGWRIGVVRVEDVALGCLASLVAGALFWPRGAAAALGTAYAEAYRTAAGYLHAAVDRLVGRGLIAAQVGATAMAAGYRLDDALRQYLAERGTKQLPLESVTTLANGAVRLRLAGTAIS
ncbi:MAG TPA: FUSC family protein, partial [Jatrophihabitans sp.]|nr:FUSC family protein [Jatrophihabitans sp.]